MFKQHVCSQQRASKFGLGCMQCGVAMRQLLLCTEGCGHHTRRLGKHVVLHMHAVLHCITVDVTMHMCAAPTQAILLLGGVDPGQVVIHGVYRAGHHLPATSRGYLNRVSAGHAQRACHKLPAIITVQLLRDVEQNTASRWHRAGHHLQPCDTDLKLWAGQQSLVSEESHIF